jgi:hypothetical protein
MAPFGSWCSVKTAVSGSSADESQTSHWLVSQ